MGSHEKEISDLVRDAEHQGFRSRRTERGHWQLYAPNGKDIVTTGPGGTDPRHLQNFRADLRRAGYRATTNLGDALRAATEKETSMDATQAANVPVNQLIKEALARHQEGLRSTDLAVIIKNRRGSVADGTVSGTLSAMKRAGEVETTDRGFYRLKRAAATPPPEPVNGAAPPPAPPAAAPPADPVTRLNEAQLDQDMEDLDSILSALAKLEGIVRRNREVRSQLQELKRLLSKF